jgi:hypothetical protein
MTRALAIPAVLALLLAGCVSRPAPDDMVLVQDYPSPDPLRLSEIVRLSKAGVSDETILDLVRARGIAEQPAPEKRQRLKSAGVSDGVLGVLASTPAAAPAPPKTKLVYRDLYLPLWPVYSGGRFRFGVRSSCWYRVESKPAAAVPEPEEPPTETLEP